MNQDELPPFPSMGEKGPRVCTAIRLYLAIIDDLPPEQVHILSTHIQGCEGCATEFRTLQQTTRLVASLPKSAPSAHIDEAILAAMQSWNSEHRTLTSTQPQQKKRTIVHTSPTRKNKAASW